MVSTIGFPGRYVQGPGAIAHLSALLKELGCENTVVVCDDIVREAVGKTVETALADAHLKFAFLRFPGECSVPAIENLAEQARRTGADCVVALGGGKTIDTGKGISKALGATLIVVPTIASNDSPTSRLIVLYDELHRVAGVQLLARNPDAVLVDTQIVAQAPKRFLAAGMGDALSKKFEAGQCHLAGGLNFFGTTSLPIARLLADQCYQAIAEHGVQALQQVEAHQRPDEHVERVVEAAVLFSGLGFESGGLSLAHALTRGFTANEMLSRMLHGELVAFGTVVQLVAQEESDDYVRDHIRLATSLRLPVCFADLGVTALEREQIAHMARLTCDAPYIGNLRPRADAQRVAWAIERADAMGAASKARG